jgi:hypothetical protein
MGLILDSSVIIAAERRGDTVEQFLERVVTHPSRVSTSTFTRQPNFGMLMPCRT